MANQPETETILRRAREILRRTAWLDDPQGTTRPLVYKTKHDALIVHPPRLRYAVNWNALQSPRRGV